MTISHLAGDCSSLGSCLSPFILTCLAISNLWRPDGRPAEESASPKRAAIGKGVVFKMYVMSNFQTLCHGELWICLGEVNNAGLYSMRYLLLRLAQAFSLRPSVLTAV